MRCPKCPGKLREVEVEDIKVDICWICEGIWFDKGEVEKVLNKDARNFNLDNLGQSEMDGKEMARLKKKINTTIGNCPRCTQETHLKREDYSLNKKLEVDICPHGHGIWLDGGEVQLLRHRSLVNIVEVWEDFKTFIEHIFEQRGKRLMSGGHDRP